MRTRQGVGSGQVMVSEWTSRMVPYTTVGLGPDELDLAATHGPKRRHEFVTGRHLARTALSACGASDVVLLREASGRPLWPSGILGAIAHCAGYVVVAATSSPSIRALGADVEPAEPLPGLVRDRVLDADEREVIARRSVPRHSDRLIFSVKECVFKAMATWAPIPLNYGSVSVTGIGTDGRVEMRIPDARLRREVEERGNVHAWWDRRLDVARVFFCLSQSTSRPSVCPVPETQGAVPG